MGRRRQAYKLEKRGNGIWYVVGTTPDGRRVHRSARTRSRKAAAQRLPLIVEQVEVGARATLSEVTKTPLEQLLAAWLTSAARASAGAGPGDDASGRAQRLAALTPLDEETKAAVRAARGAEGPEARDRHAAQIREA